MYVNENGQNGKRGGVPGLLGEITTDFLGATIPNPFAAAAVRVLARRAAQRTAAIALVKPAVNVATVPVPVPVPVSAPAPTPASSWIPQNYGSQGASSGSSFGPPDLPPVEVGTLPTGGNGDSTGSGPALAGLSMNSPLLLLAAVAAFFLLGEQKPKRRRR